MVMQMTSVLYVVTDEDGGLLFFRHPKKKDPTSCHTVGPFAYMAEDQAEAAAVRLRSDHPLFIQEVEVEWFIEIFFEGFHVTDVFMVDDVPLPITEGGAEWIGLQGGGGLNWQGAFQGDDLGWMKLVVQRLGDLVGRSEQELDDMAALVMARRDADEEFEKIQEMVQSHVRVTIIPEASALVETEGAFQVIDAKTGTFWLHTNGMSHFELPELEIRDVPAWWVTAAGAELNGWAGYFIAHPDKATPGSELEGGGPLRVSLRVRVSPDPWWETDGRACLRIEPEQVFFACENPTHQLH